MSIEYNDQEIANRLVELIKEKRYRSERAFALSINADPSTLSKVIKCKRSIPETMIDSLAEVHGVNPDWLLWGKAPKYGQDGAKRQINGTNTQGFQATIDAKYMLLLEKIVSEKEADLKAYRSAIDKITSIDEAVGTLKSTVDGLKDNFSKYKPIIEGLREFVVEEIAGLKKKSRESVGAALNIKVEAHRKKA